MVEAAAGCGIDLISRNRYELQGIQSRVPVIGDWYVVAEDFSA